MDDESNLKPQNQEEETTIHENLSNKKDNTKSKLIFTYVFLQVIICSYFISEYLVSSFLKNIIIK